MRDVRYPLYHEELEHESCGVGAIVDLTGKATHRTVDQALSIVERLAHRAGSDALGTTGDGVGIMTQIPHALFAAWAQEEGIALGEPGDYGVGMFFLPEDEVGVRNICRIFEQAVATEGIPVLGWRNVPCHPAQLGAGARRTMPRIRQCFLKRPASIAAGQDFDRRLYVLRRVFEKQDTDTYICSLSCRTVVYKGMMLVSQLRSFYDDLQDVYVLLVAQGRRFPGGPAGDEDVRPVLLLEVYEPPEGVLVYGPVLCERRDYGCAGTCEHFHASPKCSLSIRRVRVLSMLS